MPLTDYWRLYRTLPLALANNMILVLILWRQNGLKISYHRHQAWWKQNLVEMIWRWKFHCISPAFSTASASRDFHFIACANTAACALYRRTRASGGYCSRSLVNSPSDSTRMRFLYLRLSTRIILLVSPIPRIRVRHAIVLRRAARLAISISQLVIV
jgi:hypothetical protein